MVRVKARARGKGKEKEKGRVKVREKVKDRDRAKARGRPARKELASRETGMVPAGLMDRDETRSARANSPAFQNVIEPPSNSRKRKNILRSTARWWNSICAIYPTREGN